MRIDDWFLTPAERGNPATRLDDRHGGTAAWSAGNRVRPLIYGAAYFGELLARVPALQAGDLLLFTDWRGDGDERLAEAGPRVADVLAEAARATACLPETQPVTLDKDVGVGPLPAALRPGRAAAGLSAGRPSLSPVAVA